MKIILLWSSCVDYGKKEDLSSFHHHRAEKGEDEKRETTLNSV